MTVARTAVEEARRPGAALPPLPDDDPEPELPELPDPLPDPDPDPELEPELPPEVPLLPPDEPLPPLGAPPGTGASVVSPKLTS